MRREDIKLLNPPEGVGTEIALSISWLVAGSCDKCRKTAEAWNKWGPDRCEANKQKMIDHLRAEAKARGKIANALAQPAALNLLINRAIRTVRKRPKEWKRPEKNQHPPPEQKNCGCRSGDKKGSGR